MSDLYGVQKYYEFIFHTYCLPILNLRYGLVVQGWVTTIKQHIEKLLFEGGGPNLLP